MRHDLVGELRIRLWTRSSETWLNASNDGGTVEGCGLKVGSVSVEVNLLRIVLILSVTSGAPLSILCSFFHNFLESFLFSDMIFL